VDLKSKYFTLRNMKLLGGGRRSQGAAAPGYTPDSNPIFQSQLIPIV